MSIPKIINYAWFGGGVRNALAERCIQSWRRHCPGYKLVEWNESNFDVMAHPYTKAAYESGKWAYITDYVRLWVLYNFGGIYMDTDVEVVKPLDGFLSHRAFTGCETDKLWITATMGAEPGHPWIKMLLDHYDNIEFDPDHMTANTKTITDLSWPLLEKMENGRIYLKDGVVIFPIKTFCSFDHQKLQPVITPEAYAYHLFAGSWLNGTRSQERMRVQ